MGKQAQAAEWLANGAPDLLTQENQTSTALRQEAQSALNELSFLHNTQIPAMRARALQTIGGDNASQAAKADLDDQLKTFASGKTRSIAQKYAHRGVMLTRDVKPSEDGQVRGRQPGDMAVALIQAQLARSTEAGHQPDGFGRIDVTPLIKQLPGIEQIAFYERVRGADSGIVPSTVIRTDRDIPDAYHGATMRVMRNNADGQIYVVTDNADNPDEQRSWLVSSIRGQQDANAEKLIGAQVLYHGGLQTGGLTEGRNPSEPGVFQVVDPESVIRRFAPLDWNRPESSLPGYYHQAEAEWDTSIRQHAENPAVALRRQQARDRREGAIIDSTFDNAFNAPGSILDRLDERDTASRRREREFGEAGLDAISRRNDNQPFGQWFHENVYSQANDLASLTSSPDIMNQSFLDSEGAASIFDRQEPDTARSWERRGWNAQPRPAKPRTAARPAAGRTKRTPKPIATG